MRDEVAKKTGLSPRQVQVRDLFIFSPLLSFDPNVVYSGMVSGEAKLALNNKYGFLRCSRINVQERRILTQRKTPSSTRYH